MKKQPRLNRKGGTATSRWVKIVVVLAILTIGYFVARGQGVFERSTYTPPPFPKSDYIPKDVEPPKPSPFVVLAPGSGQIEIYSGIKFDKDTTTVDLSGRGLSGSLMSEIQKLSGLKKLDLSDNAFTGVPAEVGQLSQLEVLNLSNNQLTGIPREIGNLSQLRELNLSGNDISEEDLEVISSMLASTTSIIIDTSEE
jgi:hypothetical protein